MPLVMPQESNEAWAQQQKDKARQIQNQRAATRANAPLQANH